MTDEGNCWCFSSCFDCFCLGKDWGEGGVAVRQWRDEVAALTCSFLPPFCFWRGGFVGSARGEVITNVAESQLFSQISWFRIPKDRQNKREQLPAGSTRLSLRPWGGPEDCSSPLVLALRGLIHRPDPKRSICIIMWRFSGVGSQRRASKKKKGNRGMRCPSETGPKGARAKCWCTEGDGPKRWPRVRLVGEEMVFLPWHNPTVSCEAG